MDGAIDVTAVEEGNDPKGFERKTAYLAKHYQYSLQKKTPSHVWLRCKWLRE